ncbi:hypothetical protein L6164_002984 [Bauhinia variegata]|uniref:Uncharacterized protein n=1 Tax=Bauhinia variegata TaxID=167791 RepID=A0ACB9Q1D8_BAUVA|nr:hypothetical protein L6164_002984 [Bauhinia variegata]
MESESTERRRAHCLVLSYPAQGHVNPLLQFSKRLDHEGVEVTLVTSRFFCKTLHKLPSSIAVENISDGFDNGGIMEAESLEVYFKRFREIGTETLGQLIEKLDRSGNTVDCIIYDALLPWVLEVAKRLGLVGASFLTQPLVVDTLYYHVIKGNLQIPLLEERISLPGLPSLAPQDMPSFLSAYESYTAVLELVLDQFSNIEEADWVLCNSFYELEKELAEWFTKIWPKLRTIGPAIPSIFLDKRLKDDEDYGCALFKSEECIKCLDKRAKGSVLFVSFGSLVALNEGQMGEIACGLRDSGYYFLWLLPIPQSDALVEDIPVATRDIGTATPTVTVNVEADLQHHMNDSSNFNSQVSSNLQPHSRRTARNVMLPIYLQDNICLASDTTTNYPIQNSVTYDKLSQPYKNFVMQHGFRQSYSDHSLFKLGYVTEQGGASDTSYAAAKPLSIPVDPNSKLRKDEGDLLLGASSCQVQDCLTFMQFTVYYNISKALMVKDFSFQQEINCISQPLLMQIGGAVLIPEDPPQAIAFS